MIFQPTDPSEAARRTLAFLNRSCFVHHIANATPLPNLRITPREDLSRFHHQLEQLVVSLSQSFIVDDPDWHAHLSRAVEERLKSFILDLKRMRADDPARDTQLAEIRTLRTMFAVLNATKPAR